LRLNWRLEIGLRILKCKDLSLQFSILSAHGKYLLPQAFNDRVPALEGGLHNALYLLNFCEEAVLVALHLLLKSQQTRVGGTNSVVKSTVAAGKQSPESAWVYYDLIH
jgi:hypothetical protein